MRGLEKKRLALVALLIVLGGGAAFIGLHLWLNNQFQAALDALERRDFPQASSHLENYLGVRASDPSARLLAARIARRQGNFEEASRHLQLCTPGPNVELEKRLIRLQQGDLTEADQLLADYSTRPDLPETPLVLEAYIEGNVKRLRLAYMQGMTFAGSDGLAQVNRTHQVVEQWLVTRPAPADQVQGLVWRFQTHNFAHQQAKAWSDIRKAVDLDPDHREARYYLALYLAQETPAEAATHLQMLRARDPENQSVSLTLAKVRRLLGQVDESQKILDELLAANPNDVSALIERGRVALDLQQASEAERWLRRAYQLTPDSLEINLALSNCLRLAGRFEEASLYQKKFDQIEADGIRLKEKLSLGKRELTGK